MNFKIIILVLSLCIFYSFAMKKHKNKLSVSNQYDESKCDFLSYWTCSKSKYIMNRATGAFLSVGHGYDVVLKLLYRDTFCVVDCYITSSFSSYFDVVLDLEEGTNKVIWRAIEENDRGSVKWIVTKENTLFFSIAVETSEGIMALAAVDAFDKKKGLTLSKFDNEDPRQQWLIEYIRYEVESDEMIK